MNYLNKDTSSQDAMKIFAKVDSTKNGFLTIKDLIGIVFSNAGKDLQKQICKHIEYENSSTRKRFDKDAITEKDLEILFELYDIDFFGFIEVRIIKSKIKSWEFNDDIMFHLSLQMKNLKEDEMVSLLEFKRIFRNYTDD